MFSGTYHKDDVTFLLKNIFVDSTSVEEKEKNIQKNEELTLDYGNFLDENAQPFTCKCGSPNCRTTISGKKGNRIK